jgi:hypothetical protein
VLPKASALMSILDSINTTLLELKIDDQGRLVLEADAKQVKQLSLPGELGGCTRGAYTQARRAQALVSILSFPAWN